MARILKFFLVVAVVVAGILAGYYFLELQKFEYSAKNRFSGHGKVNVSLDLNGLMTAKIDHAMLEHHAVRLNEVGQGFWQLNVNRAPVKLLDNNSTVLLYLSIEFEAPKKDDLPAEADQIFATIELWQTNRTEPDAQKLHHFSFQKGILKVQQLNPAQGKTFAATVSLSGDAGSFSGTFDFVLEPPPPLMHL